MVFVQFLQRRDGASQYMGTRLAHAERLSQRLWLMDSFLTLDGPSYTSGDELVATGSLHFHRR
jgi:hypothetical protein